MEHILTCQCGQDILVTPSQAGSELECQACARIVNVPKLRELRQLPSKKLETTDASYSKAANPWRTWRGPAMALATCVFFVATTMATWFAYQRFSLDLSYTPDTEVENGNQRIDELDVRRLSLEWQEYSTKGLGQKRTPPFVLLRLYGEERAFLAKVAAAVSAVALIVMLGVLGSAGSYKRKSLNP